jgi:hypothetical protein
MPISSNLKKIENSFNEVMVVINQRKDLERIHKDDTFNKMYSVVLSSLVDVEILFLRLEKNLERISKTSKKIDGRNQKEDREIISKEGQRLRKKIQKLQRECSVDFKAVYIFQKIFYDKHISLFRFLFNWRSVGNKSITNFYNDISSYEGDNEEIIFFKKKYLNRLRAIYIFITQYRDDYIIHEQNAHKDIPRWILFEYKDIRIFGNRPSITINDMLFILLNYINDTTEFIKNRFKID